jgi:acetolactate synthase I/II/III large subunit
MNTAKILVELLKEYGVEHIFGVPGDTSMPLYGALYAARDEITHIMARDERSAAFMADAYARLTHKPGITEAPSGGGATYVIPGVAEANGSSVPMLVFTSDVPITDEGKGTTMISSPPQASSSAKSRFPGVSGNSPCSSRDVVGTSSPTSSN